MVVKQDQFKHNPDALRQAIFELAKRWWAAALATRIIAFVVGGLTILLSIIPKQAPFLIAVLTVISELCLWQSDRIKNTGETFLRKLELRNSFGWSLSKAEMSDLLLRIPTRLRESLQAEGMDEQYFASAEAPGPRRVLENLQESAWYSKHLSERTGHFCLLGTCILVVGSIVVLIISIETVRDFDTLSNIGRVITSAIVLVLSLGLVRLTTGYYEFSKKAGQTEEYARSLIEAGNDDLISAIKALHEYQLARATAPLIPTWMWKSMHGDLNELWQAYRCPPEAAVIMREHES